MNIKKAAAIIEEVKAGVRTRSNCAEKAEVDLKQMKAVMGLPMILI